MGAAEAETGWVEAAGWAAEVEATVEAAVRVGEAGRAAGMEGTGVTGAAAEGKSAVEGSSGGVSTELVDG